MPWIEHEREWNAAFRVHVMALLIERPDEVTGIRRTVCATVILSTFDGPAIAGLA